MLWEYGYCEKDNSCVLYKTFGNDSGDSDMLEVTANAAYLGVCSDIKEIENELEKLNKEFTDL